MKKLLLITFSLSAITAFAQFGEPIIIDNTPQSIGIKRIITTDLNNDGWQDIAVVNAYTVDRVSYYLNDGAGNYPENIAIDLDIDDPVYIAAGDFNDDGWQDLTTITQNNGEVFVYINNSEGDFTRQTIDSGTFVFGNALVVADFDDNGFDDIVAIGQHSIDYYRNVSGTFTKEHILTTDTSPNVLECMSLKTADMDNDGDLDLVTAETLGGVIYFNDGNGIFTPDIFTADTFISRLVHITDIDSDGDNDILIHHTPGQLNLYLNSSTGEMTFHSTIFNNTMIIESMQSVDINNDGFEDLYTAFGNIARAYTNTGEIGFGDEITVQVNDNIFITQTAVADIDNDGIEEFIWSGVNGTLAYQKNTTLGTQSFTISTTKLYPNPAEDVLYITGDTLPQTAAIYNTLGQKVMNTENTENGIDVSGLAKGMYILETGTIKTRFIKE